MTQQPSRLVGIACVLAVAVTGGVLAGTGAAAVWTRSLTATGTVSAGTVATSAAVTPLDGTITNDDYQTTHLVQVTNAQPAQSTFPGTSDVTLTVPPAAAGLGASMSVAVWPVATAGACTDTSDPGAGAVSAAWGTGLTSGPVAVLPGAQVSFCVRGYPTASTPSPSAPAAAQNRVNVAAALGVASTTSPTGSQSFAPAYTATLRRGNFTAQAPATGTTTIGTSMIFSFSTINDGLNGNIGRPLSPAGSCWNVAGGGDTSLPGTDLIAFTGVCVTSSTVGRNERFRQVPLPGASAYQIRSDSTNPTYGFLEATDDGTRVKAQVGDATELRQIWIGQAIAGDGLNYRQFVNAATGLCLQAPVTAGPTGYFAVAPCAADGRFRTAWYVGIAG